MSDPRPARVPWSELPKIWEAHVGEYDGGVSGVAWTVGVWIMGLREGEWSTFQKRMARELKGLAHGGATGSGAWREGQSEASYLQSATFFTLSHEKSVSEERKRELSPLAMEEARQALSRAVGPLPARCDWTLKVWEQTRRGELGPGEEECSQVADWARAAREARQLREETAQKFGARAGKPRSAKKRI